MRYSRGDVRSIKKKLKKFVSYKEGAELYNMWKSSIRSPVFIMRVAQRSTRCKICVAFPSKQKVCNILKDITELDKNPFSRDIHVKASVFETISELRLHAKDKRTEFQTGC